MATSSGSVYSDVHMICCLKQLDIAVQKWFYWTDEAGNCFKLQLDNSRGCADYSSQQQEEINLLNQCSAMFSRLR